MIPLWVGAALVGTLAPLVARHWFHHQTSRRQLPGMALILSGLAALLRVQTHSDLGLDGIRIQTKSVRILILDVSVMT